MPAYDDAGFLPTALALLVNLPLVQQVARIGGATQALAVLARC